MYTKKDIFTSLRCAAEPKQKLHTTENTGLLTEHRPITSRINTYEQTRSVSNLHLHCQTLNKVPPVNKGHLLWFTVRQPGMALSICE